MIRLSLLIATMIACSNNGKNNRSEKSEQNNSEGYGMYGEDPGLPDTPDENYDYPVEDMGYTPDSPNYEDPAVPEPGYPDYNDPYPDPADPAPADPGLDVGSVDGGSPEIAVAGCTGTTTLGCFPTLEGTKVVCKYTSPYSSCSAGCKPDTGISKYECAVLNGTCKLAIKVNGEYEAASNPTQSFACIDK